MKQILVIAMLVIAIFISSCSVFVVNNEDSHKKESDTTSVTIITSHGAQSK